MQGAQTQPFEARNVCRADFKPRAQPTSKMKSNSILVTVVLGFLLAGQARAADLRYQSSGDWTNTVAVDVSYGWQAGGSGLGGLPGAADTARLNWGGLVGNTVTLSSVAPLVNRFQFGVNESGHLVVNDGGVLTTIGSGGANSSVGNNNLNCIGRMTVNTGGQVIVTNVLFAGNGTHGYITNDGGNIRVTSHLWVGAVSGVNGEVWIRNGGVMNIGGNIGLGTVNASSASGGTGKVFVEDGGVLNLTTISAATSIWPGSALDISGSGVVIITGDRLATISAYTNSGKITAYGGTGTVGMDYGNTNAGKTTLWAIAGYTPPVEVTWDPAGNPSGTGNWSEGPNWAGGGGYPPASVTKVNFNVVGAAPCTVTTAASAAYLNMGEAGPGGTLHLTDGAILTCGAGTPSVIGNTSAAQMVVENGATASFGNQLQICLNWGAEGTLVMHGGSVSVAGLLTLGYWGGKGTARIQGGTLSLAQWDDTFTLGFESVLDVSGTGRVVINGNRKSSAEYLVSTGQITNSVGTNVLVDYNNITVGKTTIYPADLALPPAQTVWNPAANPATTGLWNECANWNGGLCPGTVTVVTFNVPDAIPCTLATAALAGVVRIGNGGPGGTLIITNGGSLTAATAAEWNSIGMNNTGLMIVEAGGSASYGNHLWIGYEPAADGTLIVNGGTVSVGGMIGLGWNGGKGTAQINSGTLNLAQLHPTDSIKGASVMNLTGTGTVLITGNQLTAVGNYIAAGKLTANGGAGTLAYGFDPGWNKTIIQIAPPRQSITGVSVGDGNVTLTCETTPGHIYHLETNPTLAPTAWTRVAGSTTNAPGTAMTFTVPVGTGEGFYRTVSP